MPTIHFRHMSETPDREQLEQQFINADEEGAIMDAFLALLPTEEQCFAEASAEHPKKFVQKLKDINASARVIMGDVQDYAGAKLMRMRCEKRRIPPRRIKYLDEELLKIYDSASDRLPVEDLSPEKEAERGRELLDECKTRAEQLKVPGLVPNSSAARGELQLLANGEGIEDTREISWKRN